jgi:hypothetical protein
MILTRQEFIDMWNSYRIGLGDYDSPLWTLEVTKNFQCHWFVCVRPINDMETHNQWCSDHCKGKMLCYSSDDENNEEWYGFTEKDDIIWWLLKWG